MKIKIVHRGPYIVTGGVPIKEKIIVPNGEGYVLQDGRELPQANTYALCRCGKSKNPPFCDGEHTKCGFVGDETAYRRPFIDRANKFKGKTVDLLDDGRCAYARFCHREEGSVWELLDKTDDPKIKEEAIIAASECSAGRLVIVDKEGNSLNLTYEPEIEVLQDPEKVCSGPLAIKGGIPLESSGGSLYDTNDRYALCRCGASSIKPFCDAKHVLNRFNDGSEDY